MPLPRCRWQCFYHRSDQVILDTQPPTCQVEINGGVAYVNDHLVTLILESSDNYGMNGMRFSHDATSWTSWEAYATSRAGPLQTNDGNKIVWRNSATWQAMWPNVMMMSS